MFGINLKHSLAIVAAGLLAAAGSASAATHQSHAAAGIQDGTSNTIAFGERAAATRGFSIDIGSSEKIAADGLGAGVPGIVTDNKDPDALVFSGDAYDNEMGITSAGDRGDSILMADMGGQLSHTQPAADGIIAVLIGL